MSDDVWTRDEIESPCVKICLIHPDTEQCVGCNRTRDEIALWSRMTPEDRRAVMDQLPSRGATHGRRGGRRARQNR